MEMYAVVECGGRQYRVEPGAQLEVNRLEGEPGSEVVLDRVLLVSDDAGVRVGTPIVENARVACTIVRHGRGRKIHGFHYKPKKNQYRHYGHRQAVTVLSVTSIS